MISNAAIAAMIFQVLFSLILFAGLIVFYKKKTGIYVKPLIVGAIGFIVFTQVLEKILHVIVIMNFPDYASHPWLFGLYGGFAAGIFEELGRFILYTWLLKKFLDYKGGLSFGIGWGGIEAVVLAFTMTLPNIIFAFLINNGTFEAVMGASLASEQISLIKETIINQGVSGYLLGSAERFFAVLMQIAFSLLVMTAVVKGKFSYVIYAILIHAIVDFPAIFYQTGYIKSLWIFEIYFAVIGILAILYSKKAKNILSK
jgi:uncharacterized membrane protein YhfC